MTPADQDRLARIRKQLGVKWDDAADETTAEFLLRLLDESNARNLNTVSRERWKLGLR